MGASPQTPALAALEIIVKKEEVDGPPLALRGPLPWRRSSLVQKYFSSAARAGVWGLAPIKERRGGCPLRSARYRGGPRLFLDSVSPKILLLPVSRTHPVPPSSNLNLNLHTTNSFPSNCLQMPTLPSLPTTVASSTPDFVERIGLCPASISI
jgi:hypothetical protein